MSSKKKVSKSGAVWRRSAVENTLDHMPKYNGYACGHGAHGDAKYNRAKAKRAWQNELEPRGARNRGLLPFLAQKGYSPLGSYHPPLRHIGADSPARAPICPRGAFLRFGNFLQPAGVVTLSFPVSQR